MVRIFGHTDTCFGDVTSPDMFYEWNGKALAPLLDLTFWSRDP